MLEKFKNFILDEKFILISIAFIALVLRFIYISNIDYYVYQHDVGPYPEIHGHAGYIYSIVNNHLSLSGVKPAEYSQHYHPPLHHFISAVFVKISLKFIHNIHKAFEALQFLTLFYTLIATYLGYLILKELNFKKSALYVGLALIAFHPTMTLFSGSINNDCLLLTINFGIILYSLKWNKNPNLKNMLVVAILTGLATLTKLSGIIIGIPFGLLMITKFIQCKELRLKIVRDFLISFIVMLPIASYWSIRNYALYHIPFNYVQNPGLKPFNVSNFVLNRFFSFDPMQFSNPYLVDFYSEYNIPIYLLKSSMFGEYSVPEKFEILAWIILISNLLLVYFAIMSAFRFLFEKFLDIGSKIYLASLYTTFLVCYSYFNKLFPYFCTEDYRYFATMLIITPLIIAFLTQNTVEKSIRYVIYATTAVFCISSFILYINIV